MYTDHHRYFSKQSKHQNTWCFSVSGTVVSVLMLFMVAMTPAFWYSPTRFSKKLVFPCRLIISIQSNGFEPGTRGVFVEYGDQCPGLRMKKQLDVHLPKNAIYMYCNMHFYSLLMSFIIYTWIKAWAKQKPLSGQFQHWETVKDLGMVQGNQEPIRHKFDVLRHQYLGTRDDFAGNWWDYVVEQNPNNFAKDSLPFPGLWILQISWNWMLKALSMEIKLSFDHCSLLNFWVCGFDFGPYLSSLQQILSTPPMFQLIRTLRPRTQTIINPLDL